MSFVTICLFYTEYGTLLHLKYDLSAIYFGILMIYFLLLSKDMQNTRSITDVLKRAIIYYSNQTLYTLSYLYPTYLYIYHSIVTYNLVYTFLPICIIYMWLYYIPLYKLFPNIDNAIHVFFKIVFKCWTHFRRFIAS